ncbi:MAG: hypothetical protein GY750_00750 [Lentisphaerae bacterium]|nr:hypothetical protein [Lentisphaerota bacterium]MCP4099949.1 hypothetical protein [Lentisphaerota bacterium]
MAKENKILAIDIGGDCLKVAQLDYPAEGGMKLEEFAFTQFFIKFHKSKFTKLTVTGHRICQSRLKIVQTPKIMIKL